MTRRRWYGVLIAIVTLTVVVSGVAWVVMGAS